MRRLLVTVLCLLGVGLMAAQPTSAVYPPGSGLTVTTDQQDYAPGLSVVVTAHACAPGASVTFTVQPTAGGPATVLTATADASGNASVTLNGSPTGASSVTATCGGASASSSFTVRGPIPKAGSDTRSSLLSAAVLVAVGLGLLVVARTRRRQPVAA